MSRWAWGAAITIMCIILWMTALTGAPEPDVLLDASPHYAIEWKDCGNHC